MSLVRSILLPIFLLLGSVFTRADESSTSNLFAALELRGMTQSIFAKDITSAWRMVRAGQSPEQEQLWRMMTHGQMPPDFGAPFYTRGDVLTVGGESYLVAYRPQPERDPEKLRRQQRRAQMRQQRGETPDTRLEENAVLVLSLLNLKSTGNLTDIHGFDPSRDILTDAEKAKNKVQFDREDSQSNLKQIALATLQYVQDYDEMLPPMRAAKNAEQMIIVNGKYTPVQVMLFPYARTTDIFLQPSTGRPYLPNWRISRKNLSDLNNTAQIILFYEDAPDVEGMRNVAFLDGHVQAVDEEKWKRIAQANKLPP